MIKKFLDTPEKARGAIFLSGSGSNAEKILISLRNQETPCWRPVVLVTDNPLKSRAGEISRFYNLPLIDLDIREFYSERGEKRVSLHTERGRRIREAWTEELRRLLEPYSIDFGILAGFVSLSNITADFPCLNVHPGDLTIEENGRRLFVGLHTVPIETAILKGYPEIRSSVIIAQPYTGSGGEMDTGPVLGLSLPVKLDLRGNSMEYLHEIASKRPESRPAGGYKDILEDIAKYNQERLKKDGDWIVFPPVVYDFASGRFGYDEENKLHYFEENSWSPIRTVIYSKTEKKPVYLP